MTFYHIVKIFFKTSTLIITTGCFTSIFVVCELRFTKYHIKWYKTTLKWYFIKTGTLLSPFPVFQFFLFDRGFLLRKNTIYQKTTLLTDKNKEIHLDSYLHCILQRQLIHHDNCLCRAADDISKIFSIFHLSFIC